MGSFSIMLKAFCLLTVFLLAVTAVTAQDLGSSNTLFGKSKKNPAPAKSAKRPTSSRSTSKPPARRPKKVAALPAKKASAAKEAASKAKTTAAKDASAKSRPAVAKPTATYDKTRFSETKTNPAAGRAEVKETKAQTVKADVSPVRPKLPPGMTEAQAADLFEDLIEDGNAARDAREYSTAESAYERAKSLKPRDSRAIYGLGNLYGDQQRWEEAESAYRMALQIESGHAITHVALSYVLTQPIPAPDLSDRYEEAERSARRAIQLAPSNALAFDQLGVALELRGLIGSETEDAYRKAIKLDPSFAPAHAHLGRLLRRRGLDKESENEYKTAVKLASDVATKVLVAEIMQSEQRFKESEKLLRKALNDDPKNPSGLLLMARALIAQKEYDEAEDVLKDSIKVSTNDFAANSLLGTLYIRQGKTELAENALLQAARFVSGHDKRHLSRQFEDVGDLYMKAGKRALAERSYRQALELDAERESIAGKLSRARFG